MNKKPIHSVVSEVLARSGKAMSAREIYERIQDERLYEFKARDPVSVVRTQLRRHCINVKVPTRAKYFRMTDDGLFALLELPVISDE